MKKYHDNNKSYGAIVEAMQQIRQNALAEEYGEDEMEEALMYEGEHEDEMTEMSPEEEEAVAQLMDEVLYETDREEDEDNLNEADSDRLARRRRRARQILLTGVGLGTALAGAYGAGKVFAPKTTAAIGGQLGDFAKAQGERLSTAASDIYGTAKNVGGQAVGAAQDVGSTTAGILQNILKSKK